MLEPTPKLWALIPAAGSGARMAGNIPKQYIDLSGKSILEHSLHCLLSHPQIAGIVVVIAQDDQRWPALQQQLPAQKIFTAIGAQERYLSVYQGLLTLKQIAKAQDWVLVHDGARPCLKRDDLDRLITTVANHSVGGLLGLRVNDTLKRSNEQGVIINTIDRTNIWQAQTPQMFRLEILLRALHEAISQQKTVTDEASAVELLGEPVLMVEGHRDNIKVTRAEDLLLAQNIIQSDQFRAK